MQTHSDKSHQFIDELQRRAAKAEKAAASVITAGEKGEEELGSWKASNGFHCRHMPDDPQGILRLSIGGGEHLPVTMNYDEIAGGVVLAAW